MTEARLAKAAALQELGDSSQNLIQQTGSLIENLLSRSLLKKTVCIDDNVQSFAVLNHAGTLAAVDQSGRYYSKDITTEDCTRRKDSGNKPLLAYPTTSAVAKGADVVALSGVVPKGDSSVLDTIVISSVNGGLSPQQIHHIGFRQQTVVLTLSADGRYVGAASSLEYWHMALRWSRFNDGHAMARKYTEPTFMDAMAQDFRSSSHEKTNVLALHIDDAYQTGKSNGFLVEGREDGCSTIAAVCGPQEGKEPFLMLCYCSLGLRLAKSCHLSRAER